MLRKGGLFRIARKLSSSILENLSKALNGFARLNELNIEPETFFGTWLQSGLRLWSRVQNRRQFFFVSLVFREVIHARRYQPLSLPRQS